MRLDEHKLRFVITSVAFLNQHLLQFMLIKKEILHLPE